MKIFITSIALVIAATFVFEVHELTKAMREPGVNLDISSKEVCRAHAEKIRDSYKGSRDCTQWMASYFPIDQQYIKDKKVSLAKVGVW